MAIKIEGKTKVLNENIIDLEKIMIEDPRAWIRKYFKAASEDDDDNLVDIRGINDIKFSSNPIQAPNHEEEEIERIEPKININK